MIHSTLVQFWHFCPSSIVAGEVRSESTINLINGSRIIYLTADNVRHIDRLRGIEISSFWADEAALFLYLIWKVMLGRLREPGGQLRGTITTTPKGLTWIYNLFVKKIDPETKEALGRPDDYEWFGGTTMDNPFTPEEYKQTLLSSYKGKWAEQEIYGKFVGYEGLVYKNFDHNVHIIDKVKFFEEYIFAIDWGFTNPMACLIIGYDSDGRCYVVREYYRKKQVLSDLIDWLNKQKQIYGDKLVAGYGDPSEPGHIQEIRDAGFTIHSANNEVIVGINKVYSQFEVAKDGKPRLYIHKRCTNIVDELTSYRFEEEKEDKEVKEAPKKVNDHACFIATTKVLTKQGYRPISSIKKGTKVLTRKGWKKVLISESTGMGDIYQINLSNGKSIKCTGNHPFWVEDKGWVSADALRYLYKLVNANKYIWKESYSKDEVIGKQKTMDTGEGLVERDIYTEISGNPIKDLYLNGIIFITRIMTRIITNFQILNVYHHLNTLNDIPQKKEIQNISKESENLQKNGIKAKKDIIGTLNTGKSHLLNVLKRGNIFVYNVVRSLYQELHKVLNSVILTANKKIFVLDIKKLNRRERVYNLFVEDCHEYFVEGVLVSNCDALRYGIYSHQFGTETYTFLEDKNNVTGLY